MKRYFISCLLLISLSVHSLMGGQKNQDPLTVVLAGMSHDHVHGFFQHYKKGTVKLLGIAEKNQKLIEKYKKLYHIPDSLFHNNLDVLVDKYKPEVVMAFNAIAEHVDVVRICAPRGIHVMVEKPLATTKKDALEISQLANQFGIEVLTNYETTWYASNQSVLEQAHQGKLGDLVKMVVHDGHQGPKEIGCSQEFLEWLTDPIANGGGALTDFGCYGANLMTHLMNNEKPLTVMASTRQLKPHVYPNVDDDATILLTYPQATGVIQASWNWPFSIKDMEVYGTKGYLQAVNEKEIRSRYKEGYAVAKSDDSALMHKDYIHYVRSVIRGEHRPDKDLSSLENNVIVVEILEAAKQSAEEGKAISLNRN